MGFSRQEYWSGVPTLLLIYKIVSPKGDQSWVFIGGTDVEAEIPILWPPDAESWFIWKDPDAGNDWGQEKGTTEDEMVGWHHRHNGHGFGWPPGVGDGQGGLVCCRSWGLKETKRLNWTENSKSIISHKLVIIKCDNASKAFHNAWIIESA